MAFKEGEYQTTKKDFEIFKKEFLAWVERFGLKDWQIVFEHGDICDPEEQVLASCLADRGSRWATITLSEQMSCIPEPVDLKRLAFHEVLELLLNPLRTMAEERFEVTYRELVAATHYVIRTMENTFFKPMT